MILFLQSQLACIAKVLFLLAYFPFRNWTWKWSINLTFECCQDKPCCQTSTKQWCLELADIHTRSTSLPKSLDWQLTIWSCVKIQIMIERRFIERKMAYGKDKYHLHLLCWSDWRRKLSSEQQDPRPTMDWFQVLTLRSHSWWQRSLSVDSRRWPVLPGEVHTGPCTYLLDVSADDKPRCEYPDYLLHNNIV